MNVIQSTSVRSVSEQGGYSSERLQEHVPLLRIARYELQAGVERIRLVEEVVDEILILDDLRALTAVRTLELGIRVLHGHLVHMPVGALYGDPPLAEGVGQQEHVDRSHVQGVPDLGLSVAGQASVLLPDLLEQPLHVHLLLGELHVVDDVLGVLDQLPEPGLVCVPCIDQGADDLLPELVVQVLLLDEEVLGGSRAADEDTQQLRAVEEDLRGVVRHLLEELVRRDLDEPLETDGRLPSLVVLARDERIEVLQDLDPASRQYAYGGLGPVDGDEPVALLVEQHRLERIREERRIAPVQESRYRLGRVYDVLDHPGLVAGPGDLPAENHHSVRRGCLVRFESSRYGIDGALDVLHRRLGLDVGRLGLLVPEIGHDIGYLLGSGNVDGDELRAPSPVVLDLLHVLLEVVLGPVL